MKYAPFKNKHLKESSRKWLRRQFCDPFVKLAKEAGYKSRASFKILEIQEKFALFDKTKTLLELGSCPGGWSQVLAPMCSRLIAVDLLPMDPIQKVEFIQGNFQDETVVAKILATLDGALVDFILSDMAPNTSGNRVIDRLKMQGLVETLFCFAPQVLAPGGGIITKIYQSALSKELKQSADRLFSRSHFFKPHASRAESQETYWICLGFKRHQHPSS